MKTDIRYTVSALLLCISVFLTPAAVFAADGTDTTPPRVSAEAVNGMLHIEATDEDSGVDAVYISGKRVNYRVNGALDLDFEDFIPGGQETAEIYAIDFAGNQSETVTLKNLGSQAPAPAPFTPDGQASVLNNATSEEGKEFYTFITPEENVFYLVIDRQRESENVYFLNAVTESDLMKLAEKNGEGSTVEESAVPVIEVCSCVRQCEAGKVNTTCVVCRNSLEACTGEPAEPEEEKEDKTKEPKKNGVGTFLFILLAILAAGGAGYYLKIYKPRHDLDDAEDLDDLLDGDGPEVNEDTEMQEQAYTENGQPDMDAAFYDDYPDNGGIDASAE